jgi:hypothetical protein
MALPKVSPHFGPVWFQPTGVTMTDDQSLLDIREPTKAPAMGKPATGPLPAPDKR